MIGIGEVPAIVTVTQVMMRLGERSPRDIEKPRKFRRAESAEAFGDVSCYGRR